MSSLFVKVKNNPLGQWFIRLSARISELDGYSCGPPANPAEVAAGSKGKKARLWYYRDHGPSLIALVLPHPLITVVKILQYFPMLCDQTTPPGKVAYSAFQTVKETWYFWQIPVSQIYYRQVNSLLQTRGIIFITVGKSLLNTIFFLFQHLIRQHLLKKHLPAKSSRVSLALL